MKVQLYLRKLRYIQGFPGGSEVKPSARNKGDMGSIPGSGRSPGAGNGNHSSILAWRILWTEEPGGIVHGFTILYLLKRDKILNTMDDKELKIK